GGLLRRERLPQADRGLRRDHEGFPHVGGNRVCGEPATQVRARRRDARRRGGARGLATARQYAGDLPQELRAPARARPGDVAAPDAARESAAWIARRRGAVARHHYSAQSGEQNAAPSSAHCTSIAARWRASAMKRWFEPVAPLLYAR